MPLTESTEIVISRSLNQTVVTGIGWSVRSRSDRQGAGRRNSGLHLRNHEVASVAAAVLQELLVGPARADRADQNRAVIQAARKSKLFLIALSYRPS